MKAIVTGINGTIGSCLKDFLEKINIEPIGWNRNYVGTGNYHEMEIFVNKVKPDFLFHLAIASIPTGIDNEGWHINYEWPSELAWLTRTLKIPFLFTSTAMVFNDFTPPPLTIHTEPNAESGYGYEKRMAEIRVREQNPNAHIVRLGWQIREAGSNNMIHYLDNKHLNEGGIYASTKWLPACSFLDDTVKTLYDIITTKAPSTYMIDSNKKWNFYEIVNSLKKYYKKEWVISSNEDFNFDQRLVDDRVSIASLNKKLADLL